jgi:hypothetical protein
MEQMGSCEEMVEPLENEQTRSWEQEEIILFSYWAGLELKISCIVRDCETEMIFQESSIVHPIDFV